MHMCSPDYADAVEREGFWERERPEWEDRKQQIINRIAQALAAADPPVDLGWVKDKRNYVRYMSVDDLAIAYFAIARTEVCKHKIWYRYHKRGKERYWYNERDRHRWGLTYGQLGQAFKGLTAVGCHRAKAARLFSVLLNLGLVAKVGNHIRGYRGNVYRIVEDGDTGAAIKHLDVPVVPLGTTRLPSGHGSLLHLREVRRWAEAERIVVDRPLGVACLTAAQEWIRPDPLYIAVDVDGRRNRVAELPILKVNHLIALKGVVVVQWWRIVRALVGGDPESVECVFVWPDTDINCLVRSRSHRVVEAFRAAMITLGGWFSVRDIGGGVQSRDVIALDAPPQDDDSNDLADLDEIFGYETDGTVCREAAEVPEWLADVAVVDEPAEAIVETQPDQEEIVISPIAREIRVDGAVTARFVRIGRAYDVELRFAEGGGEVGE